MNLQHWRVARDDDFVVREWDADGVLYDIASGDTHRLGALHLELLALLRNQACSVDELLVSLYADLPEHLSTDEQRQLIADGLAELASLSLIETTRP